MTSIATCDQTLTDLMRQASVLRDAWFGQLVSYSPKVFIPLTQLCRDVCHYCTFAQSPSSLPKPYLLPDDVLRIAQAGQKAACTEALFTLGDKPELRYEAAARWLKHHGYVSTIDYLVDMCARVSDQTGLIPHVNAGIMSREDILRLREVCASQGLMLESTSQRLCEKGGPHYGSPDKHPSVRIEMLRLLGECQVPTTTGLLIGIGETWEERLDTLYTIRDLHEQYGHIQEVIVQNFQPKPGTRMANVAPPVIDDLLRTVATARIVLGQRISIQVPPNLTAGRWAHLLDAGINDWGGISPVTIDHVNPEAPWPQLSELTRLGEQRGKTLVRRLPVYPSYAVDSERWLSPRMRKSVLRSMDGAGWARDDRWITGQSRASVLHQHFARRQSTKLLADVQAHLRDGQTPPAETLAGLFNARGSDFDAVVELANQLRTETCGDVVRYVVNRNINYTNRCTHSCGFCAFSKGGAKHLAGRPYEVNLEEIARRTREAWDRGATEVCLQGGIHPDYTGDTYLKICRTVKDAAPGIHVHAFSPLEVVHGATTLNVSVGSYLERLVDAGLGSLPGTAAEILVDDVRRLICPDKLTSQQWIDVVATAHEVGLRTTSTIMFGSVEGYDAWAAHLLALRRLQERTKGITEFVPLPFIAQEAPLYRKGKARQGPTWREAILMHAVSRIALNSAIPNIQVSWVKMGRQGVLAALNAGANDLGGTLMNESISRAAGAEHGQELPPQEMCNLILTSGRQPQQRTTLYGPASSERQRAAREAAPLEPIVMVPVKRTLQLQL